MELNFFENLMELELKGVLLFLNVYKRRVQR
jgi:hypothetical protein